MKATPLTIPEVILFEPTVFTDERGFLFESFNHKKFEEAVGYSVNFVQDNHSKSTKGVLRGLHYHLLPHIQGKILRVVQGEVFDLVVDIRKSSPTYGQWIGAILTSVNKKQLSILAGFAHGFVTIFDTVEFFYKTTNYYDSDSEGIIKWNDDTLDIDWPSIKNVQISSKDKVAKNFLESAFF